MARIWDFFVVWRLYARHHSHAYALRTACRIAIRGADF